MTTFLDSTGAIYFFGDFTESLRESLLYLGDLRRLHFPSVYKLTRRSNYQPSTTIRQYSTGRKHVLGLADDGKVWMWDSIIGYQIKPMHIDLGKNKVERVVAGRTRLLMQIFNFQVLSHSAQAGIVVPCTLKMWVSFIGHLYRTAMLLEAAAEKHLQYQI